MDFKNLLFAFILLLSTSASAQNIDTLAFQDFETAPQAPVWSFSGPVVYNSGFSSASATPANSPIGIGGSRAWESTLVSGGLVLSFSNVIIPSGYDSLRVHFNLAAMNLIGNTGGPDNLDYVLVEYSLDGGTTYTARLRVRGSSANNCSWAYSASANANAYYLPASEIMFQPTTTGLQTTFGYSNCELIFPGSITQLAVRITGRSSSSTDTWLVDNLVLTGENACSPTTSNLTAAACSTYTSPSGLHTWTNSGTYNDTIPNATGCDSVITINLSINNSSSTITTTACGSYTSPSGNYIWTTTGMYSDTIQNFASCDSIISIDLTVNNETSASLTDTACGPINSPSGNFLWTTSGNYMDTIPNAAGCDSVLTVQVTIQTVDTAISLGGNGLIANAVGATYQWALCDTGGLSPILGETQQTYTPSITGDYAVIVTQNGCTDTSRCVTVIILGNSKSVQNLIELYPNPAQDHLYLNVQSDADFEGYRIFDVTGKQLLEGKISGPKTMIQISNLETGIYILETEGAHIKFIKK